MKFFKKLAASATALMMAVGMMSFGASAYQESSTWRLNYANTPGLPSSAYHTSITDTYTPGSPARTFSVFKENCSSFSSGKSSNGVRAKVRYWTYVADKGGNVYGSGFSECFHEELESTMKNHRLSTVVAYQYQLIVRYQLINDYAVSCEMSGKYEID